MQISQGDDRSPDIEVAAGNIGGVVWTIHWTPGPGLREGLRFSAPDEFGVLPPLAGTPMAFAVNLVEGHCIVWGLVSGAAIAARVRMSNGHVIVGPVVGPDLDGAAAFAVIVPAGVDPNTVECLGRDGSTLLSERVLPEPTDASDIEARTEVTVADREASDGRGRVVLQGRVDDAWWEYAVRVESGAFRADFQLRHPGGGGGGGSGIGPRPGTSRRLRVDGSGCSGDVWHLTGWADPVVTDVVVALRSGERLHVPTAGQQLEAGFVVFAMAFPADAVAVLVEGYDQFGHRVERQDLRGHLSWLDGVIAEHRGHRARALAPVPAVGHALWQATFGSPLTEAHVVRHRSGRTELVRPVTRLDIEARWPVRPLLVPPRRAPAIERWALFGRHYRSERSQGLALSLVWFGGPALSDEPQPNDWVSLINSGALILRQFVSWNDPAGERDTANTTIRGHAATLEEESMERNNLDHLALRWREPASVGVSEPLSGIWCSVEANPRHHTIEELRRFAESLVVVSDVR